jgi:outer membrane receptor protein involved in Fe transport
VELDGTAALKRGGMLSGNLAWMKALIAEYTDEAADATYRDIEPVMSPPVTANLRWDSPADRPRGMALAVRYVDRMHLANDGNDALVVPASTLLELSLRAQRGPVTALLEVNNLLSADAYSSGYTDGSARYLYPIAPRSVLLTLRWRLD